VRKEKAMPEYVVLLRGINVGGKSLKMGPLVELFEAMNLREVRTYIQSGNVLFSATAKDAGNIKERLQARIAEQFGLEVTVILRTREELRKVIENNPLLEAGSREVERMHVTFLEEEPNSKPPADLPGAQGTMDEFSIAGKEVYLYCPGGYGKTVYSNSYFEKSLGVKATTRNWRTVNKLFEMMAAG
jgi:uncharacterized protein (DUF1697 family)